MIDDAGYARRYDFLIWPLTSSCRRFVDGVEQKTRNILLEILNRLPSQSPNQNEALRPYALELMRVAMDLLEKDNEPNAVICLRIIFELHKNYRPTLQNEVSRLTAGALVVLIS